MIVQRPQRSVQKCVMHVQSWCFANLRACLHGGGGPQIGDVTCGGSPHLSCKYDQIKMRDYMDRRVTPPKRVTPPTWGTPPPCKQALNLFGLFGVPVAIDIGVTEVSYYLSVNLVMIRICLRHLFLLQTGNGGGNVDSPTTKTTAISR